MRYHDEDYIYVCAKCGGTDLCANWEVWLPINSSTSDRQHSDYLDGEFYMDYIQCETCGDEEGYEVIKRKDWERQNTMMKEPENE